MAGRVNMEAFHQKQKMIKDISATKEKGMEYSNALNNAVIVWKVLVENPQVQSEEALSDIQDLVNFFLGLKQEIKKEGMTEEEVVNAAKETFPGSEITPPSQPDPPAAGFKPWTKPQRGKIFGTLKDKGITNEKQQLAFASKVLKVGFIESFDGMNDGRGPSISQANELIKAALEVRKS